VRAVLAGLVRVVGRFPFVALAALVGTCAAIMAVDSASSSFANVIMACGLGLPVMFALRVVRESRFGGRTIGLLLEVAGILLVAAYAWSIPSDSSKFTGMIWIRYSLLALGLHFAVAFVPCLSGAGEPEYWEFNWALFGRFALTTLYSAVLFVGLATAVVSCDKLFDLRVDGKRYGEFWLVMAGVFHPLFFLGGVPQGPRDPAAGPSYPKGLRAFAQFALAPLVVVYVVILYAYAAKIVARWAWPHGWIAMPVCVLAVSGILAALLLQPAREIEAERWAKWYWKYFFKALAPLSVLLILSIWRRESEYGVTEWRYYGMVVGGWLLVTSLAFSARPGASTRAIPASLAILCLATVWGPWSVFSVSRADQRHHLVQVLGPGGLENGRIVPARRAFSPKEVESIRSIVGHLVRTYGIESITDMLPKDLKAAASGSGGRYSFAANDQASEQIVDYIAGTKHAPEAPQRRAQEFSVDLDLSCGLPVGGYQMLYHACICPGETAESVGGLSVTYSGTGAPEFKYKGNSLDATAAAARMKAATAAAMKGARKLPPSEMSASVSSGPREWLVIIDKLSVRKNSDGSATPTNLDIYVLER
jgi:hypothetical protein